MSKESGTGCDTGVGRVDSKLDPSLQSDRAAGKAAKLRLFWAVRWEGLRHRQRAGSSHSALWKPQSSSGQQRTPWDGCLTPRKQRGDSEDSHLKDVGKPQWHGWLRKCGREAGPRMLLKGSACCMLTKGTGRSEPDPRRQVTQDARGSSGKSKGPALEQVVPG